ncbi:peptidase S1 [Kyrpidia spormannii]|uniref:Peptidase S1 n=1 Tax=Kyrpidia spormannii TaxID=2055160 RepID=A0A2K8NAD0_9BACL|nr:MULTISPECIES: trypsin-like peptidase domain-containing protein [Kyrpidia]ATY86296.1 peptidase S1 [Kyrpidia spormannii]MCL6577677.1 trypsin-like peptidase domain-containing protein [Kyrpidia sp.]
MGFYDTDAEGMRPRRRGPLSWLAVIVVSAMIGSIVTMLFLPAMIRSHLVNLPVAQAPGTNLAPPSGVQQTVSYTVDTGIVQAVNKVKPAIVGVVNVAKVPDFWRGQMVQKDQGVGSGVIFDPRGYVVTNNHVVEGASAVEVVLANGQRVKASIVGTDPLTDLAVLRIPADQVKADMVATFGNSDTLQPGEPAIAIGNPLGLEFRQTVTVGVISATGRTLPITDSQGQVVWEQDVIQTDAAINPGNSGGALCNIEGQVIGINSSKITQTAQGPVEGLGFAIPINEAKPIIQQLITNGKVIRPVLGITAVSLQELPLESRPQVPVDYGVVVGQPTAGAAAAGLQEGDVIVQVDNTPVHNVSDLRKALFVKKPGDTVSVTFYRGQQKLTVNVKLSAAS